MWLLTHVVRQIIICPVIGVGRKQIILMVALDIQPTAAFAENYYVHG